MFTGNLTSKRPKHVQMRPTVQPRVTKRIFELKNSGMGFRNISKQLEKEGLAKISKTTVENYWKRAHNPTVSAAKKLFNNPKLNAYPNKKLSYKTM
jgi:intein-encoded DNA endonuclease-like protein